MDYKDLGFIAETARKYDPPIRVSLQPGGLLFETYSRPFILKHLLSYDKLQQYQGSPQNLAKSVMDKMHDEILDSIRDAEEAAAESNN